MRIGVFVHISVQLRKLLAVLVVLPTRLYLVSMAPIGHLVYL